MKINLNRNEIWLIKFTLNQKINSLKNECMEQQNIIDRLEKNKKNYDVSSALELARMLFENSQADLKKYIEVYNRFKKL